MNNIKESFYEGVTKMSVPKAVTENYPELNRTILSGYRGSIAHGM
jgi:hypothetical protein